LTDALFLVGNWDRLAIDRLHLPAEGLHANTSNRKMND